MRFTCCVLCCVAGLLVAPEVSGAKEAPYSLGTNRFLFLDGFLQDRATGVKLVVNPPRNVKLVLIADQPWEVGGIINYNCVLWDPSIERYRMYYVPICWDVSPGYCYAMATSKDGIQWEKPTLGAVEWKGSKENNIVLWGQREGTFFIDPHGPPSRRYAIISSEPDIKTRLFTSPDGVHFEMDAKPICSLHSDAQISTFWDPDEQKFFHYPRIFVGRLRAVGFVSTRRIDQPWPKPAEIPVVMSRDDRDPPELDLYTNAAQKYPLAPKTYVAFPAPYYHYFRPPERAHLNEPTLASGGKKNDGTIEAQLATSRDGRTWIRYRTPYIPLEQYDGCDLKVIHVFPGLFQEDDRLVQYFSGYTFTHGDTQARYGKGGRGLGGIFRVEQRLDGFISLDFEYTGGELITEPFTFRGSRLLLNINTSASGEARVAILDADRNEISGFGISEARYINGSYLEKQAAWKQGHDVGALAGQPIRLRFVCRGTKLYSFRFAE